MNNTKIVLYFFGYSCTGKSAVETLVRKKFPGLYTVDYDVQKRQLSGYHRNKDREKVREIVRGLFEVVCKIGKPVLLASTPLGNEAEYLAYANVAETHGYEFHSFEFTASREILISRYRERLEQYKSMGEKDSLKSESEFLETLNKPNYIPENTVTFDTSDTPSEQIANHILSLIGQPVS